MKVLFVGIALFMVLSPATVPSVSAQWSGVNRQMGDFRVKMKLYRFEESDEKIKYALFVSSKVKNKKKNKEHKKYPLIILVHGWGTGSATFMRGNMLDLAQDEGCIVVGPTGYTPNAAFGVPVGSGPKPPPIAGKLMI